MRIGIIDYRAGNLRNVQKAVERLGHQSQVVSSGAELGRCEAMILPGVGAFKRGMDNLSVGGFPDAIRHEVLIKGKPMLGICLGLQLLGTQGDEGGGTEGLALLPMVVRRFDLSRLDRRLPHIGWSNVDVVPGSRLFCGVPQGADFYFVHSYHVDCDDSSLVAARCEYGYPFVAAVERANIFGVQFHPEKSQRYGLQLLTNFLAYCESVV